MKELTYVMQALCSIGMIGAMYLVGLSLQAQRLDFLPVQFACFIMLAALFLAQFIFRRGL